jgi:lysophospholipase L1-like esterase
MHRVHSHSLSILTLVAIIGLLVSACTPNRRVLSRSGAPGQDYLHSDFRCQNGPVGIEASERIMVRYELLRAEFHKKNQRKGRAFAVIMGDSIAALFHDGRLKKYLGEFDFANRGIPGDTTPLLQERIVRDGLALRPRFLILSIGGNDILNGRCLSSVLKNTAAILKTVRRVSPGTRVILASVPPVLSYKANSITPFYNRRLEYLAARHGSSVIFFDLWPHMAEEEAPRLKAKYRQELPGGRMDRVHFNEEGYKQWALLLRPSATPLRKNRLTPVDPWPFYRTRTCPHVSRVPRAT